VIPEIDIWRVVTLMLKRYGDQAEVESARRAGELWEGGDAAGVAVWRRVMGAVRQLMNTKPPTLALNGETLITRISGRAAQPR
jgi:hypothetical protein